MSNTHSINLPYISFNYVILYIVIQAIKIIIKWENRNRKFIHLSNNLNYFKIFHFPFPIVVSGLTPIFTLYIWNKSLIWYEIIINTWFQSLKGIQPLVCNTLLCVTYQHSYKTICPFVYTFFFFNRMRPRKCAYISSRIIS